MARTHHSPARLQPSVDDRLMAENVALADRLHRLRPVLANLVRDLARIRRENAALRRENLRLQGLLAGRR